MTSGFDRARERLERLREERTSVDESFERVELQRSVEELRLIQQRAIEAKLQRLDDKIHQLRVREQRLKCGVRVVWGDRPERGVRRPMGGYNGYNRDPCCWEDRLALQGGGRRDYWSDGAGDSWNRISYAAERLCWSDRGRYMSRYV